jgi:hypothetical protein
MANQMRKITKKKEPIRRSAPKATAFLHAFCLIADNKSMYE